MNPLHAVLSSAPVKGYTHNFYRYPARFSPQFARAMIIQFSDPGDLVLDPFTGSATTLVEALSTGRRAIGIDVNPLACFVANVKTTPLSENDQETILTWLDDLDLSKGESGDRSSDPVVNLPRSAHLFFERVIWQVDQLPMARQRRFARCALLRTGQWAIDCRDALPSKGQLVEKFRSSVTEMIVGLDEFVRDCGKSGFPKNKITGLRQLFCRSTIGVEGEPLFASRTDRPRLVVTSPPYPGVHVLYHRWQVHGRRETPAPYWLAAQNDGHGAAYYTFGSRSRSGLDNYFKTLTDSFQSVRQIIQPDAMVVQLVAFADAQSQLPLYLRAMQDAGYRETTLSPADRQSRIWRKVPNRKWYSRMRENQDTAREVLLLHRPS
jgi:DNA methylase